jgi:hypothetical protein
MRTFTAFNFPRHASQLEGFYSLGDAERADLERLYDGALSLDEMSRTVARCSAYAHAKGILAYLKVPKDRLGIPEPLWEKEGDVRSETYRAQLEGMAPDRREVILGQLVSTYLAAEGTPGGEATEKLQHCAGILVGFGVLGDRANALADQLPPRSCWVPLGDLSDEERNQPIGASR